MLSLATIKALQIYGIAIAVSMFVAVLIKGPHKPRKTHCQGDSGPAEKC